MSDTSLQDWYSGPDGTRDIAQEAYTEALGYLEAEFQGNKANALMWTRNSTSIEDVQNFILQAQKRYQDATKFRMLRERLRKASEIMLYYGTALDMLAQQHPEYVSLAWGTVKFIFIGIINHAELVAEFAKALTDVGEVLPRAKLNAKLYQTDMMKEAVVGLYRHILLFLQKALEWYQFSPGWRAVSAVIRPFKPDLKNTIDEVKRCATVMEAVAGSCMKAELRDTHSMVRKFNNHINDMEARFTEPLATLTAKMDEGWRTIIEHKAILNEIRGDVGDMRPRIFDIQFGQATRFLKPERCQAEALRKQQSLSRRGGQRWSVQNPGMAHLITSIGDWIASSEPSLLFLQAGLRAETRTKQIAVELISLLQPEAKQICWYLSDARIEDTHATLAEVLKSLASQLIALDQATMAKHLGESISCVKLHGYHTEKEWADFISLILKNLRECFIIVEAEDVYRLIKRDVSQLSQLRAVFQSMIDKARDAGCKCKILVAGYGVMGVEPRLTTQSAASSSKTVSVPALDPIPARLRRVSPRSPSEHPAWQALKRKARYGDKRVDSCASQRDLAGSSIGPVD